MDSLYNLLAGKFDEPPEIAAIKSYIRDTYNSDASVQVRERDIVISVSSAALASRLRFDMQNLKKSTSITQKIVLRIG